MSHHVAITPSAKHALQRCIEVYGQGDEIRTWIRAFTELTSRRIEAGSIDVGTILKDVLESPEAAKKENWEKSWAFLRSASLVAKVQTLYHLVTRRTPPIQLRATTAEFCFLGIILRTVTAFYEINHVDRQIVIRHFDGLPYEE